MSDLRLSVLESGISANERAAFAAKLQSLIDGEVRFDRHDRLLYSTDASIYQVEPIGVVVPRSIDDVRQVVKCCHERGVPILPRGGGTALAGQSVNHAVIIDFSAHCTGITDVDATHRTATVEPGVVLAQLNQHLQQYELLFGPDVATATHANIGGMIGNNSAGAHSILYGRTVENLLGLQVMLADGREVTLSEGAAERDAIVHQLTQAVADVVLPIAEQIDAAYPTTLRRCGGYNLDLILQQLRASTPGTYDKVNLAHLLCGSEGTLGVTLGATVKLVDRPRSKGLAIAGFATVEHALRAVAPILETNPAAVELVDDVVIGLALKNNECRPYVQLMPQLPDSPTNAVLYVEYVAEDDSEISAKFAALASQLPGCSIKSYTDSAAMMQAWKLRASGEPLLHGVPGDRKPLTFVEDAAVDPARLCEFIAEFRRIVESHDTTAAYYAHASVGCLHVRPMINLRDANDRKAMQAIAAEVSDLAKRFGGSNSAEHGDGRLRSHLLESFYGKPIVDAFRAIKAVFDPHDRMNPGNIVEPTPMLEHLRVRPHDRFVQSPSVQTYFSYDREGGFGSAVEMCNGAGVCRKRQGGTMCPSYRATLDERHATRGRGNALRLAVTGQLGGDGRLPQWDDAETLKTLDLCLSCKACKSECPSNVDVAKLKAEYLAQSHASRGGPPLRSRIFGHVRTLNRLGSAIHPIANAPANWSPSRSLANRMLGLDARRSLPRFGPSLHRWFAAREQPVNTNAPAVVLYPDCFTTYNEPHIGRAAVQVLESMGYRVVLPRVGCCGRSMISVGMLREARQTCSATAKELQRIMQREKALAVVGCEPSCISAIIDDWPELQLDIDQHDLRQLVSRTFAVEQFIESHWDEHPRTPTFGTDTDSRPVMLHGHCHQKALWGTAATESLLTRACGDRLRVIDSGCCGMAGSFGYTRDHYDISMDIGELSLMPAIREAGDAAIIAPGTSCRHQIKDATGCAAMHPVELLHKLNRSPDAPLATPGRAQ